MPDIPNDKAGAQEPINFVEGNRPVSDGDKGIAARVQFYLQEVAKLFPVNACFGFVAVWQDESKIESFSFGTLSPAEISAVAADIARNMTSQREGHNA